jgi:hypothetical protein
MWSHMESKLLEVGKTDFFSVHDKNDLMHWLSFSEEPIEEDSMEDSTYILKFIDI